MLFFYFLSFLTFFYDSCWNRNSRLKPALVIRTGAPMKAANDAVEMLPVVIDKTINDLSK